jgi:hypothetical protein
MQRRSVVLHGSLGCNLRDTLQEGSVDAVACFPVPRGLTCGGLSSFLCLIKNKLQEKEVEATKQKEEKRKKTKARGARRHAKASALPS